MQKFIFIFSFFLLANFSFAQVNLVPNFSFEQNDTCPNSQDQIQYATGWSKYSDVSSTSDYYNSCAASGTFSVPYNATGYQAAHRNCNAYAGIITWAWANGREQIGIQLTQSLIVGQRYFISFYAVMSEAYIVGNYYGMPSNNIGIRLSTVTYNGSNPAPINNFAHLYSSVIINDSINWIRISGSIIADSAYDYLIVGNFFDNINTDTLHYSCGTCLNNFSYYYIDDICVSTDSLLCNGGIDTLPCIVGVSETVSDYEIKLFPNPASGFVNLSCQNNENMEIILYDIFGKIVFADKIENGNNININLMNFSSGAYFLKIMNDKNQNFTTKKIIKL